MKKVTSLILILVTALTLVLGVGMAQKTQPARQPVQAQSAQSQSSDDEAGEAQEDEAEGAEENEAQEGGEMNEAQENEAEEASMGSAPAQPLTDYGSVSLDGAVKAAQSQLGVSAQPFEATLEKLNGQLVLMMDFVQPAKQVVIDANGAGFVTSSDLQSVPNADAALSGYGQVALPDAVNLAKQAYGRPADVTEVALEKDSSLGNVLTWRIDVGDQLVVINADDGSVLAQTPLKTPAM